MNTTDLIQKQIDLENHSLQEIKDKYYKKQLEGQPLSPEFTLLKKAIEPFEISVKKFLTAEKKGSANHVRPELSRMDSWDIAYITLSTLIYSKLHEGHPVQKAAEQLGKTLEDHLNYRKTVEETPRYMAVVENSIKSSHPAHRRGILLHVQNRMNVSRIRWKKKFKVDVGLKLISLLIESTGLFYLGQGQWYKKGTVKAVFCHPETEKWLNKAHEKASTMHPLHIPMIVPPKDWTGRHDGGYYTKQMPLIAGSTIDRVSEVNDNTHIPQLVLDTINTMQRTPWRINTRILDVAKELIEREYRLGVLDSIEDIIWPPKPVPADQMDQWKKDNPEEFKHWKKRMAAAYDEIQSRKSKALQQWTTISVADKFREYENIYFPWNMDFRGRMYTVSYPLSPQGSGLAKGLLEFAEPRPLGESGAYWLAVHGANCYGEDKIPMDERVAWVMDNEDQILASAEDPLSSLFWTEADSPWEFLAFCLEWKGYIKEGPDFQSRIKVAVDGSCNGLQHLAAMLRDEKGGEVVNLRNFPERRDIYTTIAEQVAEYVSQDAKAGNKWAKMWDGKVSRKMVKRNVMTVPYGATEQGMTDQIVQEVKAITVDGWTDIKVEAYKACNYLAKRVMQAVRNTLFKAIEVMDWMKECVHIFNDAGQGVIWSVPTGMTVEQCKYRTRAKRIKTLLGKQTVYLSLQEGTQKLDKTKQTNGIAPNIVHSLDAAHQVMTIEACMEQGVEHLGMVHDSFGCHAANMDVLYRTLREQFVKLYSQNILEDLRAQLKAQLPEPFREQIPELPESGNLDLSEILESEYFFA